MSTATLADGTVMVTEDLWFPAVTAGTTSRPWVRIGVLGATGVGLVLAAVVSARRRRDGLDVELADLLQKQRTS